MGTLASLISQVTFENDSTSTSSGGGAFTVVMIFVYLAIAIVLIASMWKLFSKAGQPGWAAIVPILNLIVLWKLLKIEVYWIILAFVPCLNIAWAVASPFFIARAYGKSAGYGVGILLLPIIFLPMLAFGSAQYQSEPDPLF